MSPRSALLACTCWMMLGAAAPALAQELDPVRQAGVLLADPQLDAYRGGYLIAGDIAFQFGAVTRTYENGALALESQLTWTPTGPVVSQKAGGGTTQLSATQDSYVTAGGSTLMHDLSNGRISNVLLNTQNGQTFRQETDATLILPGFGATQQNMIQNLTGFQLANDVAIGGVRAVAR